MNTMNTCEQVPPPDCYITDKVVAMCDCEWLWSCAARWRYRADLENKTQKDLNISISN